MTIMKNRILLVDDEQDVLDGLRRILSMYYIVETACGGEAAIRLIENSEPFSIVISDMRMPYIDGVAVLEVARLRSSETVRIILSGFSDYESAQAAVNKGAVDQMLSKPVRRDELLRVLNDAAELHWERKSERDFRRQLPGDIGEISAEMVRALELGEFSLVYQARIRTGAVVGYEALMRWNSSRYGPMSPQVFINIAELTGFIVPLTEWALIEACSQMMNWMQDGLPPMKVAVNVSPRCVSEGVLLPAVREALQRSTLPADLLEIEITESVPVEDPGILVEQISLLKEMGIDVSLDDFGSGFCSLAYVNVFQVSKLKLDKSLIDSLRMDGNGMVVLESMVSMSRKLGLNIVAEGVETEDQARLLGEMGCDIVQGYFYGKPMPASEVMDHAFVPSIRISGLDGYADCLVH
jgi:EAL domain-containing protein (putative c-di-GMP-specific phosphodiesterase class I)/CheY-like chemotaxis protein